MIIGMSGIAGSGKDSCANIIIKNDTVHICSYSFPASVKTIK